ncbi:MAG: hypothetical protein WCP39_05340, partial [Chlamydiota bacterium]
MSIVKLSPSYTKAFAQVLDRGDGSWNFFSVVKCCLQWTAVLTGSKKESRIIGMIGNALDVSIIRKMPGTFWRFRESISQVHQGQGKKEALVYNGFDAVSDVTTFMHFLSSTQVWQFTKRFS